MNSLFEIKLISFRIKVAKKFDKLKNILVLLDSQVKATRGFFQKKRWKVNVKSISIYFIRIPFLKYEI